jgi:hypothetical protein
MPQAAFIPFATKIVAAFAGVSTSAVITGAALYGGSVAAVAGTLSFIAVTAASMAASKLLAPKMPSFSDASLSERSQMVRSPIAARSIIYGRSRVSGTLVYISTTGTKNEFLNLVVTLAGHEVESIDEIYFNDELVPLTGTNNFPDSGSLYDGVALINKKRGVPGDAADADLELETAGLTDGKWTANHKLSGIAYLYVRLTWDAEKFPSGIPNISAVIRGKQVFDPRTSATAYSANAALCLRDYLTDSTLGMGMSAAEVDDTAFTVAANICDEQVEIKPITVPATNENRYEANGVIVTSASPDENIGKLLSAMGGLIAYTGGRIVPYASAYRIPTVTLDEKHFVGPLNVQTRTSARDRVNSVKGVYVSETNNWQVTDFPTISSATYVTADNNTVFFRDVVLPFTTSPSCAQRLAVLELRRAREEITFTARFRLEAMQVRAGDTVMISNAKLGWSSKVFEVMEWHFASDGNPPQIYVDMTLRETASSVYSWTVTDEIAVADSPNTTLPNPFTLSAPTNLTLTADGTTQQIQADGTALPRIRVSWTAPTEGFIQSGGTVGIEYKESTSTSYLTWGTVPGDQTTDFISSDVKIGLTYNVRIYGESYFKVSTSYLVATVNVQKDTTPPAVPTSLTAIAGTGQIISLDWADNTEPDLGEYGVYRNTTNNSGAAAEIAQTRASRFVDVSLTLNQQYFYWVTAYDRSENQSAKSAVASATAVAVVAGQVDPTPPVDPAAPTVASTTTYLSSDGTSLAQIVISVPAFTTRTAVMNVLYRKSGASGYIVADQRSTGGGTSAIDDLTPSVTYEIAVQAFSAFGVGSNIISGGTQVAPSNTTAPSAPSASYISGENGAPVSQGAIPMYAIGVSITAASTSDISRVEVKIVTSNDPTATGPAWFAQGNQSLFSSAITPSGSLVVFFYAVIPSTAGFGFARALSRSGVASTWTAVGSVQSFTSLIKRPLGTVSQYDSDDVETTGIKTGGGASTRQINAIFSDSVVVTLAGGATSETFNVSLTNRGFSVKPDIGTAQCASDANIVAAYDFDSGSNSGTNAVVRVTTIDGANITAGNYRFSVEFTDYT